MKNILTIFKKEFYRVMSDRRLIFTTIVLPGLAIYLMYTAMGGAMENNQSEMSTYEISAYVENVPEEFEEYLDSMDAKVIIHSANDLEEESVLKNLKDGEIDIYISFEENFMVALNNYEEDNYTLPNLDVYYNPGEKYSDYALNELYGYLNGFLHSEAISVDRYGTAYDMATFNADNGYAPYQIQYENKGIGQGLSMLLPMLIVMFLFSGAMSIGPDSIAGEKERGTIATLLITPVKRSEIAIGKVISLSVISLFSAASSFVGIMLSLPNLIGDSSVPETGSIISIYSFSDYFMLFTIIFMTVLVIVGLISVISAYAKTIKEASTLILPFYFISVIIGISTMFNGEASTDIYAYLIPIYNSVNMIIAILSYEVEGVYFLVTVLSSLVYVSILIFVLNRFFQSEKLMFSK